MEKLFKLLSALFCLSLLYGCSSTKYLEKDTGTNLKYWITESVNVDHYNLSNCTYLPGMFGGDMFLDGRYEAIKSEEKILAPEIHVVYTVTAYPDYADGGCYITFIDITDPKIYVYGLSMSSTEDEVTEIMKKQEFKSKGNNTWYKNNCLFMFSSNSIRIKADVSNKNHIVF